LATWEPPAGPETGPALLGLATIGAADTVTVACAVAQLDGLAAGSFAGGFRFGVRWHAAIEGSTADDQRQFFLGVFA